MERQDNALLELGITLIRMGLGGSRTDSAQPGMALIIDLDDFVVRRQRWGHDVAESGRASVERAVREWMSQTDSRAVVAPFGLDEFAIFFSPPSDQNAVTYARLLAEGLRSLIADRSPFTATVGVGGYHEGPGGLAASLQEAMTAKQRKLLYGGNKVICLPSEEADSPIDPPAQPPPLETMDESAGKLALHKWLMRVCTTPGVTPEGVRSSVARMLLAWVREGRLAGIESPGGLPISSYMTLLGQLETIHEYSYLEQWLEQILHQMSDVRQRADQNQRLTPVRRALEIIEARCDEDLTLAEVAKLVYVNPFYLSRLFRQELGVTFMDTLIRARVERATNLLATSSLSVAEVAAAVGYRDEKHFRSVFKERMGVPPASYRRQSRATSSGKG